MFCKRIVFLVVFVFLFLSSMRPAFAIVESRIPEVIDFNQAQKDNTSSGRQTREVHSNGTFDDMQVALYRNMAGKIGGFPVADGGATGTLIGYIGDLYKNPPATTERYVADLMHDMHLGIAQPAYAQGLGFSALDPILPLWKIFRNIAYTGFVLIFLVIGFMIMFRQKIGSQTVVTVQQAIPSILIALLAVTFSYAIAGLLIDLMYLIMFLLIAMLGGLVKDPSLLNGTTLINGNVVQITLNLITQNTAGQAGQAAGDFINNLFGQGVAGFVANFLSTISVAVIVFLVIVFNMFKLFFALLKIYIDLIINIAFAPVILMLGAIPGQNAFGPWLKNIIGDLAVFPAILLFLLVFYILRSSTETFSSGGFLPPYLGGTGSANVIPFFAALALILALPNVVDEVKKSISGNQGGLFATLIQAGFKNASDKRRAGIAAAGLVAGVPLGAGVGAAVGYGLGKNRGLTGSQLGASVARGALIGAAVPPAVTIVPPLAGGLSRFGTGLTGLVVGGSAALPTVNNLLARTRKPRVRPVATPPPGVGAGAAAGGAAPAGATPGGGGIPGGGVAGGVNPLQRPQPPAGPPPSS